MAGPALMVRETIRALARAGILQERIHYDDALLAEDKRLGPRPVQGETEKTGDTGNAGARDSAAESTPQDGNPPDSETGSETEGEPPEQEQVPAGVLAAQHDTPPG